MTRKVSGGAIPAGWRLVPEEPTADMIAAAFPDAYEDSPSASQCAEIWSAMLSAVPTPKVVETTAQRQAREVMNPRSAGVRVASDGQLYNAPTPEVAIPPDMRPWAGGDGAPEDWDEDGPTLRRSGKVYDRSATACRVAAIGQEEAWRHSGGGGDIIAYTPTPTATAGGGVRYLADHFEWAAPGDQQEDAWIVRFCDNDVRDMLFTGPGAEKEAWTAWERHAPGYNMYVFRLARLATPAPGGGEVER